MNALAVIFLAILGMTGGEMIASLCTKSKGSYQVANPNNCSKFLRCEGYNGTELSCLDDKLFDAKLLICLPPSAALCAVYDIPDYAHDLCKNLPDNELVPGIDCSKYYKCNGRNTTALTCPNGQHFSRAYKTCMNPLRAGCKALNAMCTQYDYRFPSLKCDKYYFCKRNTGGKLEPTLASCAGTKYFNYDQQRCVEQHLSGCSNEEGGTTPSPGGSCDNAPVPKCDSSNSGAFFPHPKPDWFYMCFNSKPLELQCETGLTYDTLLKYCVKENANRVC